MRFKLNTFIFPRVALVQTNPAARKAANVKAVLVLVFSSRSTKRQKLLTISMLLNPEQSMPLHLC